MVLPERDYMTEAEYLVFEAESDLKYEYADGNLIEMSGASEGHNIIAVNLSTELNIQLRGGTCRVYQSDMRVQVKFGGTYRYPDVIVVCGNREFVKDVTPDTLTNPMVLVEILSESTKSTDYIQKLNEYRKIETLQEYLIVSQTEPRIERYLRQNTETWIYTDLKGLNRVLTLPSINCTLQLSNVFINVDFDESS